MKSISQSSRQLNNEFAYNLKVFGHIDGSIILLIITLCIITFPSIRSLQPEHVVVYKDNTIIATYPITGDKTFTIHGAYGPVSVSIKNRSVAIINTTCPQRICQRTGAISTPHSQIICTPNHILITITSTKKDSIDGIAR